VELFEVKGSGQLSGRQCSQADDLTPKYAMT
jgi:hypothetical protein